MYIYNDKDSLFQWDLNQKVVVENELVKEVHFSNASTTKALIVEVVDGMANIPNILLQNTWDIKAYGYCGECVRETLIINVIARVKPDDYIYTETEIKTYENVIAQVEENTEKLNSHLSGEDYVVRVVANGSNFVRIIYPGGGEWMSSQGALSVSLDNLERHKTYRFEILNNSREKIESFSFFWSELKDYEYNYRTPDKLKIISYPKKTVYFDTEDFNGDGMVLKAEYKAPYEKFNSIITDYEIMEGTETFEVFYKGRCGGVVGRRINPEFSKNTWNTINWVCKNSNPADFWNVGDYKMLDLGLDSYRFEYYLNGKWVNLSSYYYDRARVVDITGGKTGTYTFECQYLDNKDTYQVFYTVKDVNDEVIYHSTESHGCSYGGSRSSNKLRIYAPDDKKYPATIIGFNHDKTEDKTTHSKDRASITFQIGANRDVYGDDKAGLFNLYMDGVMADSTHYKSPNDNGGPSNWRDCVMRAKLQDILTNSEIEKYAVPVKKQTSHHWETEQKSAAYLNTVDKVFLPSEYEFYGEVLYAPAREGEQYELYRDGYNKFMWSQELLDGTLANERIHFRSGVGIKVNPNRVDSSYNCGMYLASDPMSCVYSYSSGAGYIVPCFCM